MSAADLSRFGVLWITQTHLLPLIYLFISVNLRLNQYHEKFWKSNENVRIYGDGEMYIAAMSLLYVVEYWFLLYTQQTDKITPMWMPVTMFFRPWLHLRAMWRLQYCSHDSESKFGPQNKPTLISFKSWLSLVIPKTFWRRCISLQKWHWLNCKCIETPVIVVQINVVLVTKWVWINLNHMFLSFDNSKNLLK